MKSHSLISGAVWCVLLLALLGCGTLVSNAQQIVQDDNAQQTLWYNNAPHTVQYNSGYTASGTSLQVEFNSEVTKGDLVLVAESTSSSETLLTPTDSQGNSFSQLIGSQETGLIINSGHSVAAIYLATAGSSAADTVTCRLSATDQYDNLHCHIYEVKGATATVDQEGSSFQTGSSLSVSTSAATRNANDYLLAFFSDDDTPATYTAGWGWGDTAQTIDILGGDSALSEDKVVTAKGVQKATATASASGDTYVNLMVALGGTSTVISLGDVPGFEYGNTLYDPNLTKLHDDEKEIGRRFTYMVGYSGWASNSGYIDFASTQPTMDALHDAGYSIVFTWEAMNWQVTTIDPTYSYSAILSRQHDAFIQQWAHDAAAWGKPFFLRVFHEMNGNWYNWGLGVNGNTPALARQAWRHVYNIFQQQGATNVRFLWCPNVRGPEDYDTYPMASYYPGDAYVSWIGLDGYNFAAPYGLPWYTFDEVFQPTYNEIETTISSSIPIMVAEVGSNPGSGATDRANWITEMGTNAPTLSPMIKALSYYNDGSVAYDDDPDSLAAFTNLAHSPQWQGGPPLDRCYWAVNWTEPPQWPWCNGNRIVRMVAGE